MYFINKKNILIVTLFIFLIICIINPNQIQAVNNTYINLSAQGAVLIDVNSGRILYEKNPDNKMRIASLTKIMTAIIAIEESDLNSIVSTSDNAYGVEGSSIYLKPKEKLTLENMLYGLMMRSGNDAAVAVAEHVGGTVDGFVYLMNEKAAYLGMNNSHFTNPHGLDNEEHYSTPRDMAILTAYALKNESFKKIVSTKKKSVPLEGEDWNREWMNKNKLLYMYEWADGVKTGYTKLAKRCLASSATKEGVQLACITLNASDDWNDHIRLLEYGFNTYKQCDLSSINEYIETVTINGKEYDVISDGQFTYPLNEEEQNHITKNVNINLENNYLNFESKRKAGRIEFYLNDKYIGSSPLKIYIDKE